PWRAAFAIGLALTFTVSGGKFFSFSNALVYSLEKQYIPPIQMPEAAAIVVLGGGTKPATPPRPWVDVSEAGDRILYGSLLYRQNKAPWLILSGGRMDWQGIESPESNDMAQIAQAMGVPASAILQDPTSLNTYENAVNVKQILSQNNIQGPVLLVTSAVHMPRSVAIFERQGMEVIPAPTDFLVASAADPVENPGNWRGQILSIIPDAAALREFTLALKEYIGLVIYRLRGWA
ncbi:MAG: YdcF family protein, partial [Oscillatoriales cyanobacterium SM2_3_0]|nr:YdcF family protein [Oscillatoriales cyanobacterium SM2_3_0]